jgi:hypothetical protein
MTWAGPPVKLYITFFLAYKGPFESTFDYRTWVREGPRCGSRIGCKWFFIYFSNLQIYRTVLKFIKNIPPPSWAAAVGGHPRRLGASTVDSPDCRGPHWLGLILLFFYFMKL